MSKRVAVVFILAGLGSGCAHQPVKPAYVSPVPFQSWNCAQLHTEYARISTHISQGIETPSRTGVGVGIGLGGGWGYRGGWGVVPSISIGMGESRNTQRTQLAELYGQQDAIAQTAQFKGCPIQHPRDAKS